MREILITLLLLFYSENSISQNGWVWKSPYPQGNSVKKIFLTTDNKVFAIGDGGTIMASTNNGANWSFFNKLCGVTGNFNSYYVLNNNEIFLGSTNGIIIKTNNGGTNWFVLYNFMTGEYSGYILSLDFRNSLTGYTLMDNYLYKTVNGGSNWSSEYYFSGFPIDDMRFISPDTGFVCASAVIDKNGLFELGVLKTVNGGINWTQVYSFYSGITSDFKFFNSTTGMLIYNNGFLTTSNGGVNWNTNYNTNLSSMINSYYAFSPLAFYAGCNGNAFNITTNGGINWVSKPVPFYTSFSMGFTNQNSGYILGWNNLIYRTSNAGTNWALLTERNGNGTAADNLYDHFFLNNYTGFVAGWNGLIKKTTDMGETWITSNTPDTYHTESVYFINNNTGFASGAYNGYGRILKSTDAGLNWSVFKLFTSQSFDFIRFVNQNTGFLASNYGAIYKTTDSGNNWTLIDSSLYYGIRSLVFINANTGFAVGNQNNLTSKILKTTNSGLNWQTVYTGSNLSKLTFVNELTGYITGTGALKTTDGGTNWFRILNSDYHYGIEFSSPNTGYLVGMYGSVWKTTNGGALWNGLECPSGKALFGAKFFNDSVGIIYGEYGTILKTYNGGGNIISNIKQNNIIPTRSSLSQNYPNPFNPSTNIKFQIANNKYVLLKVFDVIGREVQTLVNEKLKPGEFEVTFDGSALSSGVYFYRLTAGDFTETKKMLMIK
jgi:photosystem II stability/assembly factor-like uncharacterized protein